MVEAREISRLHIRNHVQDCFKKGTWRERKTVDRRLTERTDHQSIAMGDFWSFSFGFCSFIPQHPAKHKIMIVQQNIDAIECKCVVGDFFSWGVLGVGG